MASVVTQVTAPTFPGAGQPVGTGTGQANAPLINPAHRALPVLPELDSLPSEVRQYCNEIQTVVNKAKRDNGKNFEQMGIESQPQTKQNHGLFFGTVRSNAQKLADVGYPFDLKQKLDDAKCREVLDYSVATFTPSPEKITKDVQDEVNESGVIGDKCTTTEVRRTSASVNIITPWLVDKTKMRNEYEQVMYAIEEKEDDAEELNGEVVGIDSQIEKLKEEKERKMQIYRSTMNDKAKLEAAVKDLREKAKQVVDVVDARYQQKILGLNCKTNGGELTRTGYLEAMGLTLNSEYTDVKFDKVLEGLVHTAKGHCMVKRLVAFKQVMEWGDEMPEAKKQKILEKLGN
jgi:hypothetical protein